MLLELLGSAQHPERPAITASSRGKGQLSENFRKSVNRAIKTFCAHPECKGCALVAINDTAAIAELILNIEMPLAWRAKGQSPNGVRRQETVKVRFPSSYPWASPRFYLRDDFDRALPHIQPGRASLPPEPCLVYGSLDEYFLEVGLLALVEQLRVWLSRAAKGALINSVQGWEPILRSGLSGTYTADADYLRGLVTNGRGSRVLRSRYARSGAKNAELGEKAILLGEVFSEQRQLDLKKHPKLLTAIPVDKEFVIGDSISLVVWPGRTRLGKPIVASEYFPETVENLADLLVRANELGCEKALSKLLSRIDQAFASWDLDCPIPVTVFFCVRRPFHLINMTSNIELLPYAFDLRLSRGREPLQQQKNLPVVPIAQQDSVSPELLQRASGELPVAPVVMLGCGSVGSKIALHLARSGTQIRSVIDREWIEPHNLARHALLESGFAKKSDALATALKALGQQPQKFHRDILAALADNKTRNKLIPKQTGFVIDTTASLRVRCKLSSVGSTSKATRFASAALFARGQGAYLMIEGDHRIPTLDDITAEYYRQIAKDARLHETVTAEDGELHHVATGQGCGSMTMLMSDARVSSMSALLTEHIVRANQSPSADGQLIVGLHGPATNECSWSQYSINEPIVVTFPGTEGWTFRIQQRVMDIIHDDISQYQDVETGGILVGRANDRLRTISVVDVLPAPPDSERSATGFILGTQGAMQKIKDYHQRSGRTLYDVGTWHSHLIDEGPSSRDQETAKSLAGERPPPFGLLIVTPSSLHGVMHLD